MLSIDVYTCYAIAGASALAGLGLLAMVRTEQARVRYALGLFRWALLSLSALLAVQVCPLSSRPEVLKGAIGFAGVGVTLLAWAFRQLNGRRTYPAFGLLATLLVGLALWLAALGNDTQYIRALGIVFSLVSIGMALDQGLLLIGSGRQIGADVVLFVAACEFALNWVILLVWAFTQPGPYPSHWLHLPEGWVPVSALSFAVLPLAVSSVVLATVNERLMLQLRARSLSDDLTGALSRRGLRELGERMVALQAGQTQVLAVLMIDIDFFKDVNDRYGHAAGDDVLRHVTNTVRDHLREDALLARYGGEEFSVLLPVRSKAEAQSVAERLREIVELSLFETRTGEIRVTVSIGIAFHREDTNLEDDLARADACLYQAKHTGRNRVICGD